MSKFDPRSAKGSAIVAGFAQAQETVNDTAPRFTRLAPEVPTPRRAHPTDAGVDLTAQAIITPDTRITNFGQTRLEPGERKTFGSGITVAIPQGHVGLLFARSSLGAKRGLDPANAVGVIDADYRGEVIRVSTVGRLLSTPDGTGWVTVRVAETQSERRTLANEIFNNAIVPVIALTLLAIALVWVVLGRAFAPLAGLEAHLIGREPENLAPVDLPVPVEVGHLVAALNGFMERPAASLCRCCIPTSPRASRHQAPCPSQSAWSVWS